MQALQSSRWATAPASLRLLSDGAVGRLLRPLGNTPPTTHGGWPRTSPGLGTGTQNPNPLASGQRTRPCNTPTLPGAASPPRPFRHPRAPLPAGDGVAAGAAAAAGGRQGGQEPLPPRSWVLRHGRSALLRWDEAERGSGAGEGDSAAVCASPAPGLASSVGAGARPAAGARPRHRAAGAAVGGGGQRSWSVRRRKGCAAGGLLPARACGTGLRRPVGGGYRAPRVRGTGRCFAGRAPEWWAAVPGGFWRG